MIYEKAILFLISAIAKAGLRPLGHVRLQLRMVWQRYRLMLLFKASLRWAAFSSRESAIQRYDCISTAGPRYSSEFHQYEGHEVLQHAHRMHSYRPSSLLRSALDWRFSRPCEWMLVDVLMDGIMGKAYIGRWRVALEVRLDGLVLLVELGHVGDQILDDIGVWQRVDTALLGCVGRNAA